MDMNVRGVADVAVQGKSTSSSTTTMGKNEFLQLLMVQLQNQDPTNPVDNSAMLAQLAQFSALEQQQRMGDLMEEFVKSTQRNEQISAVNYIGKTVRAKGYELTKEGKDISTVYYSSNEAIHSGKVYVYGPSGEVVYTENIGSKQAGFYEFKWDGKDGSGKEMPDGKYTIAIQAKTKEDKTILVHTEVSGEVVSAVTENGKTYLRLKDARVIELDSVYEVYQPRLSEKPQEDTEQKPDNSTPESTPENQNGTGNTTGNPNNNARRRNIFAPRVRSFS